MPEPVQGSTKALNGAVEEDVEATWADPDHRYAMVKGLLLPVFNAKFLSRDGDTYVYREPWEAKGKAWANALVVSAWEMKFAIIAGARNRLRSVVAVHHACVTSSLIYARTSGERFRLRERAKNWDDL